ncbi:MAG: DUF2914 domain-containing protein [Bacteroidota bacterium]
MRFLPLYGLLVFLAFTSCNEPPENTSAEPVVQEAEVPSQPATTIQVLDAKICKEVEDRMPIEVGTVFALEEKVYCWMELETESVPDSVIVKWINAGDLQLTQALEIKSETYRTFCNKTLYFPGTWTVSIQDPAGNELRAIDFEVTE